MNTYGLLHIPHNLCHKQVQEKISHTHPFSRDGGQGQKELFWLSQSLAAFFLFLCNKVHLAKGLEPALPFQLLVQPSLLGSPYAVVSSAYGENFYCQTCKRHTQ